MHDSKSPESVRGFVIAASAVIILSLCLQMLLNWIENPFNAFKTPIERHINDTQSTAFLRAERNQQMRWLAQEGLRANDHQLLLGTSQLLYGMDTCAYPDMRRLALYTLQMHEIAQLLRLDGPQLQAPLTLLIQENFGSSESQVSSTFKESEQWTWRDLLDRQTTEISLANLKASLGTNRPPCAAIPYDFSGPIDLSPEHTKAALKQQSERLADPSGLNEVLASMMPLCRRLHPRVVIFTLPVYFDTGVAPGLHRFFQQNALSSRGAIEAFNRQTDECNVVFIDLATSYTEQNPEGASKEEWFDQRHFKPAVGSQLLMNITNTR